jgi:hypothetical protein
MEELDPTLGHAGAKVRNVARPEWGVGTVVRVQPARVGGRPAQRVSVQFATGCRTLLVPPARLVVAGPEPGRATGWLDTVGRTTLDDKLRGLPESVTALLAPRERLAALISLYAVTEEPGALLRWARVQTGVADPLAHWTRDELRVALRDFCRARDVCLRETAALLKRAAGLQALEEIVGAVPSALSQPVRAALRRPI